MKKIKITVILISTMFMVSCTSSTYQEISATVINPTYDKNVQPIIKANCTSCHFEDNQLPNLETYEQVRQATEFGSLICRIDQTQACGSVMPQGGAMPRQNIDLIILWQKQGYIK